MYIHKERAANYLKIFLGTFLMALSTALFFTPVGMVPGGFTGLSIILRYVTNGRFPVWFWNIVLNIPLIAIAVKVRGWKFMRRTLLTSVLFSVWLILIPEVDIVNGNLFLVSVIGGCLMGVGLGLVFAGNSTTGGTDTIAALFQKYFPYLNTARIMPVLDVVVILLSIQIFGMEVSMYAVITVLISGLLADKVLAGQRNACLTYIISDSYGEISHAIIEEMGRGATILSGKGTYTNSPRQVLFCAVDKRQSAALREIVSDIDPKAFFIMTDASEVRGEGFLTYNDEEI